MYGSQEDIKYNQKLFFVDGITFMPSMALLSATAVVPFFLNHLGASTFQIALATAMTMVCVFISQPFFGFIASRSAIMNKTFSKILFIQRVSFLLFVLLIPVLSGHNAVMINVFLVFWCVFNFFVGSYAVFFTPLIIKLLPPDKRGALRGFGLAIGSLLGFGASALMPMIFRYITFPYSYMVILGLGIGFLLVNATLFYLLRQSKDMEPNEPMSMGQYLKKMPEAVSESPPFRAMILACVFVAIANAVLPFYTLYGIREFNATESHVAIFAGLAILAGAVAHIFFGFLLDKFGARVNAAISACLIIAAGAMALISSSLTLLFVSWFFANVGQTFFMTSVSLLTGEISPKAKIPLYAGVFTTISTALSALIVLVIAPVLENLGFIPVFAIVLACGVISLAINVLVLRKRMAVGVGAGADGVA